MASSFHKAGFLVCQSTVQMVLPSLRSSWEVELIGDRVHVALKAGARSTRCEVLSSMEALKFGRVWGAVEIGTAGYYFDFTITEQSLGGRRLQYGLLATSAGGGPPMAEVGDPGVWEAEEDLDLSNGRS